MPNIGRNDPCPCGSGKKYKRCYLDNSHICATREKENTEKSEKSHEEKVKYMVDTLLPMTEEMSNLFYETETGIEIVPTRMQLIGVFTMIDVLAHYWNEYLGKSSKTSDRFIDYVNRFCLVPENKEFAERKYLGDMSADDLYTLRNGLVHFYGLAEGRYCILPNVSKTRSVEEVDKTYKNFTELKNRLKKDLIFIQPFELKRIVIQSAALMLGHFNKLENDSLSSADVKSAHVAGIDRICQKLQKEGASLITQEVADKLDKKLTQ